jgi:hypothetical protein
VPGCSIAFLMLALPVGVHCSWCLAVEVVRWCPCFGQLSQRLSERTTTAWGHANSCRCVLWFCRPVMGDVSEVSHVMGILGMQPYKSQELALLALVITSNHASSSSALHVVQDAFETVMGILCMRCVCVKFYRIPCVTRCCTFKTGHR